MAKVKMTLYELISKLKRYEDRLKKFNIGDKIFIGSYTKADPTVRGLDIETAAQTMKGNFDSYMSLKSNVFALRAALYEANIANTVTIPALKEEPITLAEAISRYANIDKDIDFITTIRNQKDRILSFIESENADKLSAATIYREVPKMLSDTKKKDGDAAAFSEAESNYRELYTRKLLDPNKLVENNWVENELDRLQQLKETYHIKIMQADVSIEVEVELAD